ncbi:MAG TPA: hypothetical protein VFZ32_15605, partial [Micromonosporaceae bacterium]
MTTDEAAALRDVCAITRLDSRDALLLHRHATVVYHLPRADAVARIAPSDHAEAARLSIQVTRWLLSSGFPATAPLDIEQPVVVRHSVVTFWHYHPQGNLPLPPVTRLAGLLRRLHSFGSPPFPLPPYKPLKGFLSALATFGHAVLQKEEHEFLRNRAD